MHGAPKSIYGRSDPTIRVQASDPSILSEFRRGLHPFNICVAAICAALAGAAAMISIVQSALFDVTGFGSAVNAILVAVTMFTLITLFHTAGHAYYGWRFARGVNASRAGRHQQAVSLLAPAGHKRMAHFDPHGIAAAALLASRSQESKSANATRA